MTQFHFYSRPDLGTTYEIPFWPKDPKSPTGVRNKYRGDEIEISTVVNQS